MKLYQIILASLLLFGSCRQSNFELFVDTELLANRSHYLNTLKLDKINQNNLLLECYFIQETPKTDIVHLNQNIKFLFQDYATKSFSLIRRVKVYILVPDGEESNNYEFLDMSLKDFKLYLQDYKDPYLRSAYNKLFVLNSEYHERNIINNLNHLSAEYLNNRSLERIHSEGYDITLTIKDLLNNCYTITEADRMTKDIVKTLQESNPYFPVVYQELKEYFDSLCQ
ncbi:hypothetical protein N9B82_04905 [Saprospiraceae bacterium]|nr:hypothetical protein [Saprospiraceae bacterium]